jgi:adapter protein MecA 1/2
MRIERISNDKIKIFLTFDDLNDRGIRKEDLWSDIPKVYDFFNELMEEAYDQLGFEVRGPIAVEIFALLAQGMVIVVTNGNTRRTSQNVDEDLYSLEVTLEESDTVIYAFDDFECLLGAIKRVNPYLVYGGQLYFYNEKYYLVFDALDVIEKELDSFISLLSEFGSASSITRTFLEEYGKLIVAEDATKVICTKFTL